MIQIFYLAYYTAEHHKRKANRYYFIDTNFDRYLPENPAAVRRFPQEMRKNRFAASIFFRWVGIFIFVKSTVYDLGGDCC